ncbi:cache domain-containing protein, partial [Undibacterium rugosum]
CITILMLDGWRSWSSREIQLREAEVSTANMARAISQHADDTIKSADIAITGIVERVEHDGLGSASLRRLHDVLVRETKELPQLKGLFVFDSKGNWLVNSLSNAPTNINNADRDYFIFHQHHISNEPYIGIPVRSRSSGVWIITVSRRINNADGSFGGVALATLDVNYFNQFYDKFNIGKKGAIVLVLNQGILLTRRPLLADSIGKSMQGTTVLKASTEKQNGTFVVKSAQDGVVR